MLQQDVRVKEILLSCKFIGMGYLVCETMLLLIKRIRFQDIFIKSEYLEANERKKGCSRCSPLVIIEMSWWHYLFINQCTYALSTGLFMIYIHKLICLTQ